MPPESEKVLTVTWPKTIYVCPECGEQTVGKTMPCHNHGDTWGPYGEPVQVLPEAETVPLAAVKRFLAAWDEFDGPPLTPQDTYNAVAESVEGLRQSVPEREETG